MDNSLDLVKSLAENELTICKLYKHYAEIFPNLADFWDRIATDEQEHYDMLHKITTEIEAGKVVIDKNRFQLEAIEFVRKYLVEKTVESNPSQDIALANAKNIESSLLDKNTFDIFESDSIELKTTLENLRSETQEHLKIVQAKYEELYSGAIR